jgi:hypothetical protein
MGVLGPAIFGTIYTNTVATMPRTIFIAAATLMATSFVSLLFVRFPSVATMADDVEDADAEQPLMRSEEEEATTQS